MANLDAEGPRDSDPKKRRLKGVPPSMHRADSHILRPSSGKDKTGTLVSAPVGLGGVCTGLREGRLAAGRTVLVSRLGGNWHVGWGTLSIMTVV